jgi:hypothetical protein
MKLVMRLSLAVAFGCCLMGGAHAQGASSAQPYVDRQLPMLRMGGLLQLVETIPLPTQGYMDHLACDVGRQQLFISGENNNEMVVVDLRTAKVMHVTKLDAHPRKPFFDSGLDELWVDLALGPFARTVGSADGTRLSVVAVRRTAGVNQHVLLVLL